MALQREQGTVPLDDEKVVIPAVDDVSRAGRDDEFDATYRRLYPRLVGIAWRHTRDDDAAQDLLQTAAYKAFVRWRSRKPIENLEAYLTTCLLSACMDLHRWSRRERRTLERLVSSQNWYGQPSHEAVVERAERDAVKAAFGNLSNECQEILRLRIIEGVSVKEVSDRLVVAEGTVKSKCSRCLDQLDRLMSE